MSRTYFLLFAVCVAQMVHANLYSLRVNQNGDRMIQEDDSNGRSASLQSVLQEPNVLVAALYNRTMNQTGWDYLYVRPSRRYFNALNAPGGVEVAAEGYRQAGYIEGYLTVQSMWDTYVNSVNGSMTGPANEPVKSFIEVHMNFMVSLFRNRSQTSAKLAPPGFVDQLQKIWAQLEGLHEGYNAGVVANPAWTSAAAASSPFVPQPLSFYHIFLLSYEPEYSDVQTYLQAITPPTASPPLQAVEEQEDAQSATLRREKLQKMDHCSGLIKIVLDENQRTKDMYVSHDTWAAFQFMLRQYKTYDFDVNVVMSSYPGALISQDDWYMTSRGLVSLETTNAIMNNTLYAEYFSPYTVSEWMRGMIANYVANTASEWATLFAYLNSGSYNNQWMAVDMKLFKQNQTLAELPANLLWIVETVPGFAPAADVTSVLRQQAYWPSYNTPYFPFIFAVSGNLQLEQEFGSFFSYNQYARAEIFRRNQSMVTDLESMKRLMRYNNYENDPLSDIPNCTGTIYNNTCRPKRSASLAIASRGDLDPVGNGSTMGPLAGQGYIGQSDNGAIDSKIASWSSMQGGALTGFAVSGPTNDQQPTFDFRTVAPGLAPYLLPRQGVPDRFDFPWVAYPLPTGISPTPTAQAVPPYQAARLLAVDGSQDVVIEPFNTTLDSRTIATIEYNASMNSTGWDVVVVTANPTFLSANASLAYYGAGYLEGYMTAPSIYDSFVNFMLNDFAWNVNYTVERKVTEQQIAFMRQAAQHNASTANPPPLQPYLGNLTTGQTYAGQLRAILAQLDGLTKGYNQFCVENGYSTRPAFIANFSGQANFSMPRAPFPLLVEEIYLLSFQTELWDVETYVAAFNGTVPGLSWRQFSTQAGRRQRPSSSALLTDCEAEFGVRLPHRVAECFRARKSYPYSKPAERKRRDKRYHCSALIKPTDDMSDLYVSHDTWSNFNNMLRQYKTYHFEVSMSMSSYPGMLVSSDDWYITSRGLAVQETTTPMYNISLYRDYFSPSTTIAAWVRAMLATYLASSAEGWQQIFVYLNSGSYNNQWMSVDMKLFAPGTALASLPDNLVWVSETLPGFYQMADVTDVIRQQGYWGSYNDPYFPLVYALSGNLAEEMEYGSFFSYLNYSRAEIFKRNQSMVTDLDAMKRLMRYNDFQNDPLCDIPNCTGTIYNNTCMPKRSAMLAVAARGDLDPVGNVSTMGPLAGPNVGGVGLQDQAALDSKIATWSSLIPSLAGGRPSMAGFAISGPTYDQQPVYVHSTSPIEIRNDSPWRGLPDRFDFPWMQYSVVVPASNGLAPVTSSPSGNNNHHNGNSSSTTTEVDAGTIAGAVVGAVVGLVLLAAIGALICKTKRRNAGETDPLMMEAQTKAQV